MNALRRNEVDIIAHLAPHTIAFLQIPLTPARAARLADFTARTGIDAQALVLDLLDDVIFDTGVSVASQGEASCTEYSERGPPSTGKSSARSCEALHDCAVHHSDEPAKGSGHTRQPKNSRLALAAQYARPVTSSPVIESHPEDRSRPSSPKSAVGRCD